MSKSRIKLMLIVFFFYSLGIVHKEFVPPGQTVNQAFYQKVLGRLRQRVMVVHRDIASSWILHHDNAPSHTSLADREFLAEKQIAFLPHPPYSPDLAPCDFFMFPKIKKNFKGHHFGTLTNVQTAATQALNTLTVEDFQGCYEEWKNRCKRCVHSQGSYFEGDHINV
jgi:histone-lysine N-methyltransferase SETMAR